MMERLSREETIEKMNRLAKEKKAFVFIINYQGTEGFVEETSKINPDSCMFDFNGYTNVKEQTKRTFIDKVEWEYQSPSFEDYKKSFDIVQKNIIDGNSYLTNLTCKIPVQTNLSLSDIFNNSVALYKLWIKDTLVCFSPEIFIRVKDGVISSFPMKGTIEGNDEETAEKLLANKKESAEHATIVDLIRNDLSIVADHVHVKRYRYIDCLHTNKGDILQTSSEICGNVLKEYTYSPGDLLFTQLPAGSITGAPKKKTVEIIAEAETYERGFYTGVMGYWNNGNIDSAVMIRFIDQENNQLFFKAGGGITAQSKAIDEYNEVISKTYVPIR